MKSGYFNTIKPRLTVNLDDANKVKAAINSGADAIIFGGKALIISKLVSNNIKELGKLSERIISKLSFLYQDF